MNKIILISIIGTIILCLAVWSAYVQYEKLNHSLGIGTGNLFDGLRFSGNYTWASAIQHSQNAEHGHWIAINVNGMTYERCVKIAQHECGHELFAKVCEKNTSFCESVEEQLNNQTKI